MASRAGSVLGLLSFGTFASIASKAVYELQGEGRHGLHSFEKPWAMTTVMFLGMTLCLPLAWLSDCRRAQQEDKESADGSKRLAASGKPVPARVCRGLWGELWEAGVLLVPTGLDLAATLLQNVGLLTVTASAYQMLRGAELVFGALFATLFLKRKLNCMHYGGLGLCVVGVLLVGAAGLMSGAGSATRAVSRAEIARGMALVVFSQAVQAGQITFEDYFMADLGIAPMKVVGYEGLFGSATMLLVLLPLAQGLSGAEGQGLHEDSVDTWHMITHTAPLAIFLAVDMLVLAAYNVTGMMVTSHLGGVFRLVLETSRTLLVWLAGLLLFYTPLGMGRLGESWAGGASWMQAFGFTVLVAGTVVYGRGDEVATAARDAQRRLASVRSLASSPGSRNASAAELKLLVPEEQV